MSKAASVVFALSGLTWGVTALFVPTWWESPAFGNIVYPLWVHGLIWVVSGLVFAWLATGHPVRGVWAVLALSGHALSALLAGQSIIVFTVEQNAVSAIGSAIAWLSIFLLAAWYTIAVLLSLGRSGTLEVGG